MGHDDKGVGTHDHHLLRVIAEKVEDIHQQWPELYATVIGLKVQNREHERRIIRVEGIVQEYQDEKEKKQEHKAVTSQRVASFVRERYDSELTDTGVHELEKILDAREMRRAEQGELKTWRGIKQTSIRLAIEIAAAISLPIAGYLVHWLMTRH